MLKNIKEWDKIVYDFKKTKHYILVKKIADWYITNWVIVKKINDKYILSWPFRRPTTRELEKKYFK